MGIAVCWKKKKESLQMLLHGSRQGIDLADPDGPL